MLEELDLRKREEKEGRKEGRKKKVEEGTEGERESVGSTLKDPELESLKFRKEKMTK